MPASEQTWYNQKRLNFVFGISSVALLIATVWMFSKDHDRQWKQFQRKSNDIEIAMTQWRKRQFETEDVENQRLALQEKLDEIIDESEFATSDVQAFIAEVRRDAEDRGAAGSVAEKLERLLPGENEQEEPARR